MLLTFVGQSSAALMLPCNEMMPANMNMFNANTDNSAGNSADSDDVLNGSLNVSVKSTDVPPCHQILTSTVVSISIENITNDHKDCCDESCICITTGVSYLYSFNTIEFLSTSTDVFSSFAYVDFLPETPFLAYLFKPPIFS
jgi:hypothetical protein